MPYRRFEPWKVSQLAYTASRNTEGFNVNLFGELRFIKCILGLLFSVGYHVLIIDSLQRMMWGIGRGSTRTRLISLRRSFSQSAQLDNWIVFRERLSMWFHNFQILIRLIILLRYHRVNQLNCMVSLSRSAVYSTAYNSLTNRSQSTLVIRSDD